MSDLQIFCAIGDGYMEPNRKFQCMGNSAATEQEAKEAFQYEESIAQKSADSCRKSISIELRDITRGYILAHKRFEPNQLLQN